MMVLVNISQDNIMEEIILSDNMKEESKRALIPMGMCFTLAIVFPTALSNDSNAIDLIIVALAFIFMGCISVFIFLVDVKYNLTVTKEKIILKTLFGTAKINLSDIKEYKHKRYIRNGESVIYQFKIFYLEKKILVITRYYKTLNKILKEELNSRQDPEEQKSGNDSQKIEPEEHIDGNRLQNIESENNTNLQIAEHIGKLKRKMKHYSFFRGLGLIFAVVLCFIIGNLIPKDNTMSALIILAAVFLTLPLFVLIVFSIPIKVIQRKIESLEDRIDEDELQENKEELNSRQAAEDQQVASEQQVNESENISDE